MIGSSASPRILLCATGKTGLGHLRRLINIAGELARLVPQARIGLVSNAEVAGLTPDERSWLFDVHVTERERMAETLTRLQPDLVVVDTAVVAGLSALPAPLCLILRETHQTGMGRFNLESGRSWDLVCVPNPAPHWLPGSELRARQVEPVGWIYRLPEALPGQQGAKFATPPVVLAASGGGGNAETANHYRREVDGVLRRAQELSRLPFEVHQVIGPRAPSTDLLQGADHRVEVGGRLNEAFARADLVISTAGYNSVLELAILSTPVLLVPISRTHDDQVARAHYWAERMGRVHLEGDTEASAQWLVAQLASRQRRQAIELPPSGARRCAEYLLELLNCARA